MQDRQNTFHANMFFYRLNKMIGNRMKMITRIFKFSNVKTTWNSYRRKFNQIFSTWDREWWKLKQRDWIPNNSINSSNNFTCSCLSTNIKVFLWVARFLNSLLWSQHFKLLELVGRIWIFVSVSEINMDCATSSGIGYK